MDVVSLRIEGVRLGLDLTPVYKKLTYQELLKCCNGVGPEWFPEKVRAKVTGYFEFFLPSTNQHDCDFTYNNKSKREFKTANNRLYKNMKIQIAKDQRLSWFSLKNNTSKIRKYIQARFLYKMCVRWGFSAFINGGKK